MKLDATKSTMLRFLEVIYHVMTCEEVLVREAKPIDIMNC